jgi:hypothetical protein
MLVSVSRADAARLLLESVRFGVGRSGFLVEAICDAAEQLLRALTIAEADEIADTIASGEEDALGWQADRDRWQRLCRRLQDRTITGAPELVPIIGRDLALLCACAERHAESLEAAAQAEAQARVARCRELLSPEEQVSFEEIVVDDDAEIGARASGRD